MARRPPVIVWLYALLSMWKLLLLTAAVLVCVISFAAAIKPLADGKLSAGDTLKYMLLAMPAMLQYALPFAAGFGATLAYHRLSADNEAIACHAGGVSHRALLVPAAVSGVVLAGTVFVLANTVMPLVLRQMAEMVAKDAGTLLHNTLRRGDAVQFGDVVLHADYAAAPVVDDQSADGSSQRLRLGGVLVLLLDDAGSVETEITARIATVWLTQVGTPGQRGRATRVTIRPEDYFVYSKNRRFQSEKAVFVETIPSDFKDDPKYLSWKSLQELRRAPDTMNFIDQRRRALAEGLVQREIIERAREQLATRGSAELVDDSGGTVTVRGSKLRLKAGEDGWEVLADGASGAEERPIIAQQTTAPGDETKTRYSLRAARAFIDLPKPGDRDDVRRARAAMDLGDSNADGEEALWVVLRFEDVRMSSDASGNSDTAPRAGVLSERVIRGLRLKDLALPQVLDRSSSDLNATAAQWLEKRPDDGVIRRLRDDLASRSQDLFREITSKQHERLAAAVACLVMILTGAVMALRLRDSLPLAVYLWSFFPALAAVVTISAGQQLTHEHGMIGLLVLWGGVGALGVYAFSQYRLLARH
jgi:lipopolysaccharide export LptBFGC system permease protein LptF